DYQVRFELHERASRDGGVMKIVPEMFSSVAFRDVGGNRYRRPSNLARETVDLGARKGSGKPIAFHGHVQGPLPYLQIPVALEWHPDTYCRGYVASTTDEMPPRDEKTPLTLILFGLQAMTQSSRTRLTAFS